MLLELLLKDAAREFRRQLQPLSHGIGLHQPARLAMLPLQATSQAPGSRKRSALVLSGQGEI
jgi:hypothetical protein